MPLLQHRVFPASESPVPQQRGWGLWQPFGGLSPCSKLMGRGGLNLVVRLGELLVAAETRLRGRCRSKA